MIGVSSTLFTSQKVEEVIAAVSKEFEHWEIFSDGEHSIPMIFERLESILPSYNLSYSVHAPINDLNIASLSERMREAATIEHLAAIQTSAELGIKMITIHPGMRSFVTPNMDERSMAAAKKSLRTIDRLGTEYGMKVALENMPSLSFMLGRTAEEMEKLVEGTELKVCFDIGHANTCGQIDEMIDRLLDRTVNIHIHDNMGINDDHMTIGDGNINFPALMPKLGSYKGNYIIECKTLESGVESKKRLGQLL